MGAVENGPGGESGVGQRVSAAADVFNAGRDLTINDATPVLPSRPLPPVDRVDARHLVGLPRSPRRVFVGRDQVLAGLHRSLGAGAGAPRQAEVITQQPRPAVADPGPGGGGRVPDGRAVVGLGGIGKSELALQYAHRHADGYELVWWINAETSEEVQAGLARLCRELCMPLDSAAATQAPAAEAAGWAVAWLAGHSGWLLVLDNAEEPADLDELLARLSSRPARAEREEGRVGGRVLITSRRATGWDDLATVLALPVLAAAEGADLLAQTTGTSLDALALRAGFGVEGGDGGDGEGGRVLRELAEALGGLPLALNQAGAYIATVPGMTPALYLERLRESPHWALQARPLVGLGRARRPPAGAAARGDRQVVAATWTLTMDSITAALPLAGRVMRILARFAPDRLPRRVLDGLPGAAPWQVGEALGLLAAHSMIETTSDGGHVSVHRLVQAVTDAALTDDERADDQEQAADLLARSFPEDPRSLASWPVWGELVPHAHAALHPASDAMRRVLNYLDASGDYRTARDLAATRITALEYSLGPDHPETFTARHDFARWTGETGDAARARDLYAELLPHRERVQGADHPDTLATRHNLARWTGEAGDAERARDLYTELLPHRERISGPDHIGALAARHNLARWTGVAGDAARARDLYIELLPHEERILGPDHPGTLATRHNLAAWTGHAGDAERARDLYTELLPDRERVLGSYHPETLTTRANLAYWTGHAGDAGHARDLYIELLPHRERVQGPDHPDTLTARANLARWTGEAGDAARARELYAALLLERERVQGPDHPDCVVTRRNLAYWTERAEER
ncbi:tetratricopeptide repeat protein [Actinomadura parmotrematis]|uniref:Tetratricopeptide repeat protein n=1 Tax=Actinomadura parmotrematis TaxID=2864039 RepID=A0ABS7FZK5_9ACTN|nr:tetratricopeptide repeat protein [Actinomadura parmotrematis]MBW8485884.1 tetratricopeptide repeat protein [Actinomadura parmotrematis]